MLKLSILCTRFENNYSSPTSRSRENISSNRKKEGGHETQFTTKIGGKTSLGPSYLNFV
jgi:hypothetical protein